MDFVKAVAKLKELRDDIEADVNFYDGKAFNGRTVAEMHGKLSACVYALAGIVLAHFEDCQE